MTLKDIDFSVAMYGTTPIIQSNYDVAYTGDESSINLRFAVTDEPDLEGATAIVHLKFADTSHIERALELTESVFSYTLKGTENKHAGVVRADIIITKGGAKFTRAGHKFKIDTSLDASVPLVEFSVDTLDTLVDGAEEWLLQAQIDFGTAQSQRAEEWVADNDARADEFAESQTDRTNAFDASEAARTTDFNASETRRSNTFTTNENAREAAAESRETARDASYTAAEANRDSQFTATELTRSEQESGRVSAESARVTAESARVAKYNELANDLTATLAAADANIEEFDIALQNGIVATNIAAELQNLEETYAPDLVTVKAQLEQAKADLQAGIGAVTADAEVVTARSSAVKGKTFSVLDSRFEELETDVVALKNKAVKQYGVRRTLNASSTLLERLNDGVGLVANVPTDDGAAQNDFDAVYPFSQIKECIIDATGRIHYKGDPTYATAIGDWMVEVPLYYVKDVRTATTQDEYFSALKLDGYRIPKDFIREDGTVCQKIYYGRFKTGKDGTTDVSRPGLVPSNYRDLASFRTGARAKGAGWQEVSINYVKDFLHKLTKVEFANLNSQTVFGPGITTARYTATDTAVLAETAVNRFVTTTVIAANFNVGNVINIGTSIGGNNVASMRVITAINVLDASSSEIVFDGGAVNIGIGNIIAMVAQKTGQTVNLQKPSGKLSGISGRTSFKWRGIEDPFGNLYEWVDGVLINDNKGYICNKPSLFASNLTADYKPLGYTNANTNGYPFEMGYDENYPEAQFPIAVDAGSSTGYANYYYQNTGLRGAFFGGHAANGALSGLFSWNLGNAPSFAFWFLGGRLLFKPPAV